MVDLSVIVVSFASEQELPLCLHSLESEIGSLKSAVEVVVVDNASPDGSAQVVREQFPTVRLLANEQNLGFAAAVNQGLRSFQGRYALILNPDCEVTPDALSELLDFADAHPDVGIIGLQLLHPDGSLQPSGRRFPSVLEFVLTLLGGARWVNERLFGVRRDFSEPADVDEVSGAAMLVRREAWEQVGGMDEGFFLYFEDLDFCKRAKAAGWRVVYLPQAKVRHQWSKSTMRFYAISHPASVHAACRYFTKHHGVLAATLVRMAFLVREAAHIVLTLLRVHRRGSWQDHFRALLLACSSAQGGWHP